LKEIIATPKTSGNARRRYDLGTLISSLSMPSPHSNHHMLHEKSSTIVKILIR
jgi:hypothetical protein